MASLHGGALQVRRQITRGDLVDDFANAQGDRAADAQLPVTVAEAERQDEVDAVDLVIRHPGAAALQDAMAARLKSLPGCRREGHLRVETAFAQVHLPVRRHQRLEHR